MKKKTTALLTAIGLAVTLITVPLAWANQNKCVTCDGTDCEWDIGNPHNICTEFAGGNGCVASGVCELG